MATAPRPSTPRQLTSCAKLCKALGDETRLAIVELLAARSRELCACEIESHFELSQPTISHHLKLLREAGIIRCERRGAWCFFQLDAKAAESLDQLRRLFAS
jgi:DNA-binding transcriptional ArsR family regulator